MSIETPTRIITDELRGQDGYMLGYADAVEAMELGADQETSLQATRLNRRLDELVERIYQIAPYEVEEPVSEGAAFAAPEGVFDQEQAAA